MPGTCNERSIDLSVSATGFSPIEAYSQTDRRTLADFPVVIFVVKIQTGEPGMPAEDQEWLKILISAIVGMFAGLIADPVRGLIQSRIDLAKMQNAVMWDFSNLSKSAMGVHGGELPAWKFWLGVELPGFDYYWEKNRELFYTNTRLVLLRVQCEVVKRLRALVENKQQTPDEAMQKLWEVLVSVKIIHGPTIWERITQKLFHRAPHNKQ
jgi:hypothetical protein